MGRRRATKNRIATKMPKKTVTPTPALTEDLAMSMRPAELCAEKPIPSSSLLLTPDPEPLGQDEEE